MDAHLDRYISGDSPNPLRPALSSYGVQRYRYPQLPPSFSSFRLRFPRLPDAIDQVDGLYIPETLHPPDHGISISFQPLKILRHQLHPPRPYSLPRHVTSIPRALSRFDIFENSQSR